MAKVTGRASKKVSGANAKKVSANTINKAFNQMEYQKALAQMRRQLTIARKIGAIDRRRIGKRMVEGPLKEFKIPKHPTSATTKRLKKYTEYLKTMIWLQKNSEDIIDRLKEYANEVMMGNTIVAGVSKNNLPSGIPHPLTESNMNFILNTLDDAEEDLGRKKLAENIEEHYTTIKDIITEILLAIYKKDTAKWGGGSIAFELLKAAFRDLIYGRS